MNISSTVFPKVNIFEENRESKLYYLFLIFLVVLFLVFTLGEDRTGFAGTIGRVSGLVILLVIGYGLIDWSFAITESEEFWQEEEDIDEKINLRMEETSKILERASQGEKTSQDNLTDKVRKTFFTMLKERRGLIEEGLQELLMDEDRFRSVVDDDLISDFILDGPEDFEEEYEKKIEEVIGRMERWD